MIKIIYPEIKPSLKKEKEKELIFCIIRKRWYNVTPEEWVRQNFLLYLIHVLKFPASLIAVEKQLKISEVKKRFDIVVYKNALPFLIVECKEMNVPLSANTLTQVLNYNSTIQAPFMVVTNGNYCAAFEKKENEFREIFDMQGINDE
ncbi:MAG: type I restriction enzyme HsdR N-terminal domain-containing protein [Ferruginibacter sp.]|nr:type I restriction enzyme HsdR N-terminal domain-containing protein [Ferruginibacter sp.]